MGRLFSGLPSVSVSMNIIKKATMIPFVFGIIMFSVMAVILFWRDGDLPDVRIWHVGLILLLSWIISGFCSKITSKNIKRKG